MVPGGGCALLYASKIIEDLPVANQDQKVGVEIVRKALQMPAKTIVRNAGEEGSVVAGKLLEQNNTNFGYDSSVGEFKDLFEAGIIDPVKVNRNYRKKLDTQQFTRFFFRSEPGKRRNTRRIFRCKKFLF